MKTTQSNNPCVPGDLIKSNDFSEGYGQHSFAGLTMPYLEIGGEQVNSVCPSLAKACFVVTSVERDGVLNKVMAQQASDDGAIMDHGQTILFRQDPHGMSDNNNLPRVSIVGNIPFADALKR